MKSSLNQITAKEAIDQLFDGKVVLFVKGNYRHFLKINNGMLNYRIETDKSIWWTESHLTFNRFFDSELYETDGTF